MTNPASELFDVLLRWRRSEGRNNVERRGFQDDEEAVLLDHVRAMALLENIGGEIDRLKAAGRRVSAFEQAYPEWIYGVLAFTSGWNPPSSPDEDFPIQSLGTLELLADVLDHDSPTPLAPQALPILQDLLSEVLDAADNDGTLDRELALYIRSAVRHLQTCLDEYDTVGHSATMLAFQSVWVATRAAAAKSEDPTRWEKLRDRLFFPTATGLLANAPSLALQIEMLS